MKIAYLSTFYPYRGGIAQFNASLIKYLNTVSEVKAFTFTRQYPDFLFPGTSQYVADDENPDEIRAERILDTINPYNYYQCAKKIQLWKPDLLLTKFWNPFFGPSLGFISKYLRKRNVKTISILDNVKPHEKRIGNVMFTKYFLKNNDGFIAMSESVKNDLIQIKPKAKFKLTPHPLYDNFGKKPDKSFARKILNIPDSKKVLLFFGFIRQYKGLDLLLEALISLNDDFVVLIAGEPYGDMSQYYNIIETNHLSNRVIKFIRYISDKEVPVFFSASDVCVLPYKSATQSGIVGISYHFDLPVIATDVGGLSEMIEPYNTGLMVKEPNPVLIAESIKYFFNNNLNNTFQSNILNYKKIASWEGLGKEIIALYKELK